MKRFLAAMSAILFAAAVGLADFVTTANPVHTSGVRANVDLDPSQHLRNIGGSDGAGLCVGTSNEVAGRWQNLDALSGFQKWLAKRPGGSYPEMLESDLKAFTAAKGVILPPHIQHTGGDIEFLRLAIKTRRAVGITYAGFDPFYGQQGIAHMVDAAHLDGKYGAIIDNNEPGRWRWMDDAQLVNRWLGRMDNGKPILVRSRRGWMEIGGGWAVVWLTPPPPPIDSSDKNFLPERPTVVHEEDGDATPVDDRELPGVYTGPLPEDEDDPNHPIENPLFHNGVNSDKLKPAMRYWKDGEEICRGDAIAILKRMGAELSDDTGLAFFSVVSDDPAIAKLVQTALAQYAGKFHVNIYHTDSWVAKTRLKAKLTVQLPATAGGKTVYKSDTVTLDEFSKGAKAGLGIVDPPPVKPAPLPPVVPPTPAPQPAPTPNVTPSSPDAPAPSSPVNVPMWLLAVGGYLLYRSQRKSS